MDIESEKIILAKKILSLKSESIIRKVNDFIENNDWENITDEEIFAIKEGLSDIEEFGTVSNQKVSDSIDEMFKNYRSNL